MKQYLIRGGRASDIAASIERGIAAGALAGGDRLPTVRDLAASLGVSPVTVAAAYRHLQARGAVESSGRRGTRVRLLTPVFGTAMPGVRASEGAWDLANGTPDPELLPRLESALRTVHVDPRSYGESPILPALADFAGGEFAADGIPADRMAVAAGGLDAIERLLRDHLRAGDRVAVEDPSAPALLTLMAVAGYRVDPVAIDSEGPAPDALADALSSGARALIVTPRAQNPTGVALTRARAAVLEPLLRGRTDLLLIENDPVGPVAGVPAVTLASASVRWAVVRSVSKFLGPDLRLAIVAGDDLTIARLTRRYAVGPRWVSHVLQGLTLALWSDPASGRRLARAAELYAHRRAAVRDALASHGIDVVATSGFNVWIPVREETAAVQALAARGWVVAPGERFRLRSAPGIRVTTSALDVAQGRRFAGDCAEVTGPSHSESA